jgi:hypothetical protein
VKAWVVALALAYVLPAYSILRRLAEARDELGLNTLQVDGSATVAPAAAKDVAAALGVPWSRGELPLSFSVKMKLPARCRVELTSAESTRVLSAVSSNGKKKLDGGWTPLQTLADELCATLAFKGAGEGQSRAALEQHLASIKANSKVTSLGRFAGTLAYVLGDSADGSAQFWIYKEGFRPARVRLSDDKGTRWDVRLIDYTSPVMGEAFPRAVHLYKGEEMQLRLTVLNGDLKPKLDDSQF